MGYTHYYFDFDPFSPEFGTGWPHPDGAIWLNGDLAHEEDAETFLLAPDLAQTREDGLSDDDLAVCGILLRAQALMPRRLANQHASGAFQGRGQRRCPRRPSLSQAEPG